MKGMARSRRQCAASSVPSAGEFVHLIHEDAVAV